jgi:hypothetical protein
MSGPTDVLGACSASHAPSERDTAPPRFDRPGPNAMDIRHDVRGWLDTIVSLLSECNTSALVSSRSRSLLRPRLCRRPLATGKWCCVGTSNDY